MITSNQLYDLGFTAAQSFNEYDLGSQALEAGFGVEHKATKGDLLRDVTIAEREGLDLSTFSGEDSRFKFPDFNTNIVVRIYREPTPHTKLAKLAEAVAAKEAELKLAKLKLKHTTEQLIAKGECDEITARIVLAFARLSK
jgi:hypothetical protein